ncbi:odorant receptor 4-like isoform X1 [Temnothorax americanus]|uniref:odorant receptor 4-like isoform X1 n=1 Tax=Temnothorax americanus TaxID=1964332 RepID=UPI0040694BD2
MRRKVMLDEVISVVKLSLFPIWCWPLPQDATPFKMLCMKLYHCLSIILEIAFVSSVIYTITIHLDEPEIFVQLIPLTSGLIHTSLNFIFYIVNHHHIQNVTFEMVHFSGLMKLHEEIVVQRHIDKCVVYYGGSIFTFYVATFFTIALPLITEQTFPTLAEYPFDVSHEPLKTIIYIHQSAAGIIIAGQLCINSFMALLLWFATARFEILTEELGKITNAYQLFKCIKEHQELLKYAEEVAIAARPFALTTVYCSTFSSICVFLEFITNQPIAIILQGLVMVAAGLSEVFMYCWPAEYLIHMNNNVAEAAFDMLENNHFIELWKCLQIIIMRSQKPIKIAIPCLMPALSLNYFTAYLSTILSYFTTLRVVMDDDKS